MSPLALENPKWEITMVVVSQRDKQSSKQRRKLGDDFLRLLTFSSVCFERRVWLPAGSPFMLLLGCSISAILGGLTSVENMPCKLERESVISINSGLLFGSSAQQDCKRGTKSFGTSSRLGLTFWKMRVQVIKICDRNWKLVKQLLQY